MEPLGQSIVVPVADPSEVALARRTARAQALRVGLAEGRVGEIEIVAVELATNLLHHANGGKLLLNPFVLARTLEVLAVDAGPGMADTAACIEDGYSSASTPGLGLGAIGRLSDRVEVYSWPDKGTVVAASFSASPEVPSLPGVVCTALQGEEVSGDRWACKSTGGLDWYLVVDGLGHGLHASEAATLAAEIFHRATTHDVIALVKEMHGPMRATRGAALAVICFDRASHIASYCGVGNIAARLHGSERIANLVSQNGTVGHQAHLIRSFQYPFREGDLLVMHSDGISTHWSLDKYPALTQAAPSAVAAILDRDFNRGRDDATVLAVRL